MSFELEATIRDLLLSLLVVKNKSIKLPFVTWNKISLPICLLLTHELLQNAKLISFITRHHYTETTQCLGDMLLILCSSHNPLQTGLTITNRQHRRQSLLFNHQVLVLNTIIELPRLHIPHLSYLKQKIFFFFYCNSCGL